MFQGALQGARWCADRSRFQEGCGSGRIHRQHHRGHRSGEPAPSREVRWTNSGRHCREPAATTQAPATALYRRTETGEGRLSSTETIGVFIAIPITDPGGGQIMARDVTGGFEGELIGLMANFVVGFEKR